MASIKQLNQRAEIISAEGSLFMNINAAKGLHDVMRTNLGPRGTVKMLVGGAGDVRLTKDGNVLLREMQIQNPTAVMIARAAVAQDEATGDGTTTTVVLVGELMKQAERWVGEGVHPRSLVDGFSWAKQRALDFLEEFKTAVDGHDRSILHAVARTALRTKLDERLADQLSDTVTDAVLCVAEAADAARAAAAEKDGDTDGGAGAVGASKAAGIQAPSDIDLHMIEVMHMRHKLDSDTRLVRGLVLDHGSRHPDMPSELSDCHVLTCNLSLEYDKSEVNSGFFYSNAEQRETLVKAERKLVDDKVAAVVALKRQVCPPGSGKGFLVVNMKGIDPESLDALAKEGIIALRRAKKRNMERLQLACGGHEVTVVDELVPEALGWAGSVKEQVLGEEKYTFVDDVKHARSCTILIKGPNDYTIAQIKDAVRDGVRAVKNVMDDGCVVRGAGAFEVACAERVLRDAPSAGGKARIGAEAFAAAMLGLPAILAANAGHDAQEAVIAVRDAQRDGNPGAGLDLTTGGALDCELAGVYDNYIVKKQVLNTAPVMAGQLLLVDEVIRAGINMRRR